MCPLISVIWVYVLLWYWVSSSLYFIVYVIRGIVNKWFASYLCDRSQFVDIDGNTSSSKSILCGVPQGSIIGPLLDLIYVNDIHISCNSIYYPLLMIRLRLYPTLTLDPYMKKQTKKFTIYTCGSVRTNYPWMPRKLNTLSWDPNPRNVQSKIIK